MLVGYARVSTVEQKLDSQIDALKAAGCEKIFADKITGVAEARPEMDQMLGFVREGDVVVVYSISRASRSLRQLLQLVDDFGKRKIGFRSLTEPAIDTTQSSGIFMLQIFGALAQFERDLIRTRCMDGLVAARARGVKSGRKNKLSEQQRAEVKALLKGGLTPREIMKKYSVGRSLAYELKKEAEAV